MNKTEKEFLGDFVREVVELTKDQALYAPGDAFGAGYRSALYSVLHALEEQALAWDLTSNDVGLAGFSADGWRQDGLAYFDRERSE